LWDTNLILDYQQREKNTRFFEDNQTESFRLNHKVYKINTFQVNRTWISYTGSAGKQFARFPVEISHEIAAIVSVTIRLHSERKFASLTNKQTFTTKYSMDLI